MYLRSLGLGLCSFVLASYASVASAGGFYTGDIGTRGLARSGAFVASPDSVLALHYNPAGLSLLRGLHTELSVQFVQFNGKFERRCPCVTPGVDNAAMTDSELQANFDQNPSETNTPLAIPFLGVAYGLPWLDMTIGLGAWGPTSGRHDYGQPPDLTSPSFNGDASALPQRYTGIQMQNVEINFALGVALAPLKGIWDGLRIGATAMGYQSGNNQSLHLWLNLPTFADGPEDPSLDVPSLLEFQETFKMNWAVGMSVDIFDGLTLGSSFRGKRSIRAPGTLTVQLPTNIGELVSINGQSGANGRRLEVEIEAELNTAPIWRTGVQYQLPQLFSAEVAFVYEGWSTHDRVTIRPQNVTLSAPALGIETDIPRIDSVRQWKDTWSIRVGAELDLFKPLLGVQLGYFFEPSALRTGDDGQPARIDPSRIDLDKHGFSLGFGVSYYGFRVDISGMYIQMMKTEVTNGATQLVSPADLGGGFDLLTNITNGVYSGNFLIGAAKLSFSLDEFYKAREG